MQTHREKVLAALAHHEPDQLPVDLAGTESSGMTAVAALHLYRFMGINSIPRVFDPYQYVVYPDETVKTRFGIATENLSPGPESWREITLPEEGIIRVPELWKEEPYEEDTVVRDKNGNIIARRAGGSHYFDPVNPPLADVRDSSEIQRFSSMIQGVDWPFFADEGIPAMQKRAADLHAGERCVVLNLCCHLLAAGQGLRGYEEFMMDLIAEKKIAHTILETLVEGYLERVSRLAPRLSDHVDVILFNDDLGTQIGPVLNPLLYREMIKPYQATLFSGAKKAFGKPLLFHSCGAVREFIPDLIEVGVDALNPVQISAAGMDASGLKRDFGKDLCFWGGGIDPQTVLNKRTPGEVRDAVRKQVDILAPGGGFVFCQVHNIQPDVPPENIVAMYTQLG